MKSAAGAAGVLVLFCLVAAIPAAASTEWENLRNRAEKNPGALKLLQKAARDGQGKASFYLGTLYAPPITRTETTVKKSWKEALYWYRMASEQNCARADFDLGMAYEEGLGAVRNPVLSRYYFHRMMALAERRATAGLPAGGGPQPDFGRGSTVPFSAARWSHPGY